MDTLYFDGYTRIGPWYQKHSQHPWSLDHLLAELDHCSISGALVSCRESVGYDAMLGNRRLCKTLEPYDHLFPLWNVHPHWTGECPAPRDLLKQMADHDVRAVVVHPTTNGWHPLSQTSMPLWEAMQDQQVLVVVDGRTELKSDKLEELLLRFKQLPVLLRNVYWSQQREVIPLLLNHRQLHIGFDAFQVHYGLEWLLARGCEDQLVFLSNAPEMSAGAHRMYVDYVDASPQVRAKIAGGNLVRLLKGQAPPRLRVNRQEDFIMTEARAGKPLSPLVLDAHAHMLDEGLDGAGGAFPMFNGGPRGVRDMARRMGVDGMGIMSWNGIMVYDPPGGNRCVKAAIDACPDFYWGLGTFDVVHDSPQEQRRQMEELFADPRFLGLKPYIHFGIHYDDPRYETWWKFGSERGLYAGIHPNRGDYSELDVLCSRYPDMTFVGYHCGGSYAAADAAIRVAARHRNFLAEITLTPVCGGIIDYLVESCGADRVIYGSDLPMRDPRQQLGWVVFSRLSVEDKLKVLGQNTRRLIDGIRSRAAR
jgi:predicted TIM-barrel fold metal-dependent hydrolase